MNSHTAQTCDKCTQHLNCCDFSGNAYFRITARKRESLARLCHVLNTPLWGHEMRHTNRGVKLLVGATALVASVALARSAAAQSSPIAFGITAGATKAVGDGSDGINLGYHAGALVQWNGPTLPVGIRGDVVYHRFSFKDVDGASESITGGTVNAVYSFPMDKGAQITPYLIGGVGFYHASFSCSDCGESDASDNKFGINGGAGVTIPLSGFSTFIEARYHNIFTDGGSTKMIPVSFGIMFR